MTKQEYIDAREQEKEEQGLGMVWFLILWLPCIYFFNVVLGFGLWATAISSMLLAGLVGSVLASKMVDKS